MLGVIGEGREVKNMENNTIERLIDKINMDPSVLFLGQDYLGSKTGKIYFMILLIRNIVMVNCAQRQIIQTCGKK